MWKYIKGDESNFEGAPDWATVAINCRTLVGSSIDYAEKLEKGSRGLYVDDNEENTILDPFVWDVIAERVKVDDYKLTRDHVVKQINNIAGVFANQSVSEQLYDAIVAGKIDGLGKVG